MIFDEIDGPDRTAEQRNPSRPAPEPSFDRRVWDAKTDPWAPQYDPAWVGTEPPR